MKIMISENIKETVKQIATEYPETVFCGSFGLVLNGLLDREVKDLDVITHKYFLKWSGFFDQFHTNIGKSSDHWLTDGIGNVLCFKLLMNEIKVDCMYVIEHDTSFNEIDFEGVIIRVEDPKSAINAKIGYVENDQSDVSRLKHFADLVEINSLKPKELADLIRKSITKFYTPDIPFQLHNPFKFYDDDLP
jgi:hypothetical protein